MFFDGRMGSRVPFFDAAIYTADKARLGKVRRANLRCLRVRARACARARSCVYTCVLVCACVCVCVVCI